MPSAIVIGWKSPTTNVTLTSQRRPYIASVTFPLAWDLEPVLLLKAVEVVFVTTRCDSLTWIFFLMGQGKVQEIIYITEGFSWLMFIIEPIQSKTPVTMELSWFATTNFSSNFVSAVVIFVAILWRSRNTQQIFSSCLLQKPHHSKVCSSALAQRECLSKMSMLCCVG